MDTFIQAIRSISLRKWALITIIAAGLIGGLTAIAGINREMLMLSMIFVALYGAIFTISLIAHLVQDLQKIKIMIMLVVIGLIVGIWGIVNAFSGLSWMMVDWSQISASPQAMQEFNNYILTKSAVFNIIQSALYIMAMALGVSSLNRKCLIPWIILMVGYFTGLVAQLQDKDGSEFMTFSLVSSLLSFVAIIWVLVASNKLQMSTGDHK